MSEPSDDRRTRMEGWIERMKLAQRNGDTEGAHNDADEILCEALNYLGCRELVAEWEKVEKWYA